MAAGLHWVSIVVFAPDNSPGDFWSRAHSLGNDLPAAETRRLILGLLQLRRLWEVFDARRKWLARESHDSRSIHFTLSEADRARLIERPELYRSGGIAWLPRAARWTTLRAYVGQPNLGRLLDLGIGSLETDNPALHGLIPRQYGGPRVRTTAVVEWLTLIDQYVDSSLDPISALQGLLHAPADAGQSVLGSSPEARLRTLRSMTSQAPNGRLLDRLDDQLRELDKLIDQSRRTRSGGSGGD